METASTESRVLGRSVVPRSPFDSFAGLARHITIAGFAGLITGVLVGGIGGRLFMRIAGAIAGGAAQRRTTEAGFRVGEVTVGGSLELIIFIGIFSGLFGAVFYVSLFPWLRWAGRWSGVALGVLMFAATSATSDLMNPDNVDFRILGNGTALVLLILLLFVAFGVVIEGVYRLIDKRMPPPDAAVDAVYYTFSALGLFFVGLTFLALFTGETCDCGPPMGVAWSFVVAAVGTIAWWLSVLIARSPKWLGRASAVVGYVGAIGMLIFGLIRALSDAADIIG